MAASRELDNGIEVPDGTPLDPYTVGGPGNRKMTSSAWEALFLPVMTLSDEAKELPLMGHTLKPSKAWALYQTLVDDFQLDEDTTSLPLAIAATAEHVPPGELLLTPDWLEDTVGFDLNSPASVDQLAAAQALLNVRLIGHAAAVAAAAAAGVAAPPPPQLPASSDDESDFMFNIKYRHLTDVDGHFRFLATCFPWPDLGGTRDFGKSGPVIIAYCSRDTGLNTAFAGHQSYAHHSDAILPPVGLDLAGSIGDGSIALRLVTSPLGRKFPRAIIEIL